MPTGIIESLDHEARGVSRLDGKTVFVEGALPGESVEYASYRRKPSYELARTLRVLAPSAERVTPRCPHFGVCGGCSMQHLDPAAQVAVKQRLLEDNRVLVRRALGLLDPQSGERVADMFCGLGNFTLPIARSGACVVGVEGSPELVRRAAENAAANGLDDLVEYRVANLFEATVETLAALGRFDKMLIDPPREGALELIKALDSDAPQRIVYISCSPATLARDAAILVAQKSYQLRGAGVINMFPHTSHVESIALFERSPAS